MDAHQLAAYCNDELSLSERLLVENALIDDIEAQTLVREQEELDKLLHLVSEDGTRRDNIIRSVLQSIEHNTAVDLHASIMKDLPKRHSWVWQGWLIAALLLVGIGLSLLALIPRSVAQLDGDGWTLTRNNQTVLNQDIQAGDTITVHTGGHARIQCIDGSVLTLADAGVLTMNEYPEVLSGALSADIKPHAPDAPFLIRTPHGTVTVVGTRFFMEVTKNQCAVEVEHGTVRLENITLNAGESGSVDRIGTARHHGFSTLKDLSGSIIWSEDFSHPSSDEIWKGGQVVAQPAPDGSNNVFQADGSDGHNEDGQSAGYLWPARWNDTFTLSPNLVFHITLRAEHCSQILLNLGVGTDADKNNEDDFTLLLHAPLTEPSSDKWQTVSLPLSQSFINKPIHLRGSMTYAQCLERWSNLRCTHLYVHNKEKTLMHVDRIWVTAE